ncbi:MAG: hypothetical protein ACTS73_05980 [Arsenophonus sp. NEOnobi-MAG3]
MDIVKSKISLMMRLHRQATIIPKIRVVIQRSKYPAYTLAKRYGISELIVAKKWQKQNDLNDYLMLAKIIIFSQSNL